MPEFHFIESTLFTVEAADIDEAYQMFYSGHASEQSTTVEVEEYS